MKNILLIALIGFSLISCQERAAETEETTDPNLEAFEKNTEATKQLIDSFIQKDLEGMRSFLSDDFYYIGPVYGEDSINVDAWMEREQYFMDTYDDLKFEDPLFFAGLAEDMTPNGDVRIYGTWTFTHKESGWSGGVIYYSVLFFNDEGKVIRIMDWFNTSDLEPLEPDENTEG